MTPYDTDVYAWSQEQAALLDGKQWDALDIANLIEEILSVGASQYTAVSSAVYQILVHLLKWRYQPARQSRSWRVSLLEHRSRIPRRLRRAPSLAREIPLMIVEEYPAACRKASAQTGLPLATFPEDCPWTAAQVLDVDFWPEATP
jgi:Domain of unknown function DUF29